MAHSGELHKETSTMLRYSLLADESYFAGKPIYLGFQLENLTDEGFWILTWYTPLEGLRSRIFKVACSGKEIPYQGPMIKRAVPTVNDYARIGPKGSVSARIDLSEAYRLPLSSECRVEFEGRIHDIVRDKNLTNIGRDLRRGMDIKGNVASFRVVSI